MPFVHPQRDQQGGDGDVREPTSFLPKNAATEEDEAATGNPVGGPGVRPLLGLAQGEVSAGGTVQMDTQGRQHGLHTPLGERSPRSPVEGFQLRSLLRSSRSAKKFLRPSTPTTKLLLRPSLCTKRILHPSPSNTTLLRSTTIEMFLRPYFGEKSLRSSFIDKPPHVHLELRRRAPFEHG